MEDNRLSDLSASDDENRSNSITGSEFEESENSYGSQQLHLGKQQYMFEPEPENAVERPNNDESAVNDIENRSRNLES